jgi:hypothetical protein
MGESFRPFMHVGERLDSRFSFFGDSTVRDDEGLMEEDPVHRAVARELWYEVSSTKVWSSNEAASIESRVQH